MKNVQKLKLELTNEELQSVAGGKDISRDVLANFSAGRSTKDVAYLQLAASTKDNSFLA
ncbi:hypothetical protein N480_17935 [Pseudoalteromonas luteoviolacea S2607]|uniref:hypothetical protein n=1 Tax=Pseudoalteromonas luteoviolacea TaxID=43657 RepID=UPI0007B167D3|nr:hypothetical protein [Pseudoalteromonas luteoviolacea]KZN36357.1 hypothetical protein N480_17935 [Pseudoalteromonas luteoviolacea S2607]